MEGKPNSRYPLFGPATEFATKFQTAMPAFFFQLT